MNCKYCSLGVPRFRQSGGRLSTTPEELIRSLDMLFKVYDHIRHIDFTGGEALIWDLSNQGALSDIIKYCRKFEKQFDFGRILTNATIVPSDELCETIRSCGYDFDFLLDNYGKYSEKINEIKRKLDFYEIRYTEYKYYDKDQEFSGWVNIHNDSYLKDYPDSQLIEIWERCNLAHKSTARNLFNGVLYFCCTALVLRNTEGIDYPKGYVDLLDESESVADKRKKVSAWQDEPNTYCRHCNGFDPDPTRQKRILAAEQE
jgi:hypothetical protein